MSGVEDSVENYQSYWLHVVRLWCSSPMKSIFFLFFVISYEFHAQICSCPHFFTAHTSLGCRKFLIGRIVDPKPDKLLSRTLHRTHVAAHVILKVCEEDAMNDALFEPLSNYREIEPGS